MRVTHLAPTVFGADGMYGGGERYPLELARALAGHADCRLVTFGRQAREYDEPGGLRVRVLRPVLRWRGHPAHPLAPGLARALAGADVVHAHHLRSAPSRVALALGALRGRPVAVTDHGLAGGDWAGLLPRLVTRFLLVSAFSGTVLGAPAERTRLLYGGADTGRFYPRDGLPRSGVLFVGRLTPHKGVDRLIRALPAGVPLTVIGEPGHDPRPPESGYPRLLAELARGKRVRFLGAVADARMPEHYRRARVLVLPSVERTCYGRHVPVSELLGLTALEAMASGTPVVCSRVGGLPEVVADGVTGLLVEPGDVAGLRAAIERLTGDPALAARLGAGARAVVLARFTWDRCARVCLDSYAEMLAA